MSRSESMSPADFVFLVGSAFSVRSNERDRLLIHRPIPCRLRLQNFRCFVERNLHRAASGAGHDNPGERPSSQRLKGLDPDRHWIYFSVSEERDSGSIVDFANRL